MKANLWCMGFTMLSTNTWKGKAKSGGSRVFRESSNSFFHFVFRSFLFCISVPVWSITAHSLITSYLAQFPSIKETLGVSLYTDLLYQADVLCQHMKFVGAAETTRGKQLTFIYQSDHSIGTLSHIPRTSCRTLEFISRENGRAHQARPQSQHETANESAGRPLSLRL